MLVDYLNIVSKTNIYKSLIFVACWLIFDGNTDFHFSSESLWALLYLSIIGSLFGFVAYFQILKSMSIATISLIPLMTPVLAVIWGGLLAGERVDMSTLIGGGCILLALGLYQGSFVFLWGRLVNGYKLLGKGG